MHKPRGSHEKATHWMYLHMQVKPVYRLQDSFARIISFGLRLDAEKPWVFSFENLARYSEFDLQAKNEKS